MRVASSKGRGLSCEGREMGDAWSSPLPSAGRIREFVWERGEGALVGPASSVTSLSDVYLLSLVMTEQVGVVTGALHRMRSFLLVRQFLA